MHTETTTTSDRHRPSADLPVPDDIVDILLWRLATDVMFQHQPGPDGHCANLRCAYEQGPCAAAVQAQRAVRAAHDRTAPAAVTSHPPMSSQATAIRPAPAGSRASAVVGRATVRGCTGEFTGWFVSTANAMHRWHPGHHLPHRIPGAAFVAA